MADELGIIWLEEPFAPDNIDAFKKLLEYRDSKNLQIEIVSGENCHPLTLQQRLWNLAYIVSKQILAE